MSDTIIRTGCLPYEDGSGYELNITIESANAHFDYERVRLNPDSEFADFPIDKWPEVRAAIERAINARVRLEPPKGEEQP